MDGSYCFNLVAVEASAGTVGEIVESGARKVLAEGPHSEIAEDPERRWTEDF